MTQRPCLRCVFWAAISLLSLRLVLMLIWLINSSFLLQPFSGTSVPNSVLPILGLLVVLIGLIIDFGLIVNGRGAVRC